MFINEIGMPSLLETIKADTDVKRFTARVFFISKLETYFELIDILSEMADVTIYLSDAAFCAGRDTVPDLQKVIDYLDENKDKSILIPNVGEYLRVAEAKERDSSHLFSILNRQVHSKKRVWIPIFGAKALFQSVIGVLDEERFDDSLYEIVDDSACFEAKVYANSFAKETSIVDAVGTREWLALWDNKKVQSGMSFCTRQINQITASGGDYVIHKINSPYTYIIESLKQSNSKLCEELGTPAQWAYLSPHIVGSGGSLEKLFTSALNEITFDPYQILGSFNSISANKKWLFWLWYRLELNQFSDYISLAVLKAKNFESVVPEIEGAILSCTDNVRFDEYIEQRRHALSCLAIDELGAKFWNAFDHLSDDRVKIKILNGNTHEERIRIIKLISNLLKHGKKLSELRPLLMDKMPDLALYLSESKSISGTLGDYINAYKKSKITDTFTPDFESNLEKVNIYDYDTRSQILYGIKQKCNAYYLWVDGMGLEWVDMLLAKVSLLDKNLSNPEITIGCAVIPTTTMVNMEKTDKETVSYKYNRLDSLSHIKDKMDCNYYSIIDKQFGVVAEIADLIVTIAQDNPDKDIIITADHGMSRMAAKSFHETQGINAPKTSNVRNLGRYCELLSTTNAPEFSNTIREGCVVAYKNHNHFTASGFAPGEIHGGATPEEILVPIIHYKKLGSISENCHAKVSYTLITKTTYVDSNGMVRLTIQTTGPVSAMKVEIDSMHMLTATASGESLWTVDVKGLQAGETHSIRVYLNNYYTNNVDLFVIKRRGLEVDDDI